MSAGTHSSVFIQPWTPARRMPLLTLRSSLPLSESTEKLHRHAKVCLTTVLDITQSKLMNEIKQHAIQQLSHTGRPSSVCENRNHRGSRWVHVAATTEVYLWEQNPASALQTLGDREPRGRVKIMGHAMWYHCVHTIPGKQTQMPGSLGRLHDI